MTAASANAFFVTGTDTEIGKTWITSALLRAFAQSGLRSVGMKPIAAGAQWLQDQQTSQFLWRNEDVDALDAASTEHPPLEWRCPYLMKTAAAPHVAAQIDGVSLESSLIIERFAKLRECADVVVVEGVGGFRVPLTDTFDTADLAQILGLPVILVVGLRLGCISQALLTYEAIVARGLTVAGWVANSTQLEMPFESDNISAIEQRLAAPCLGHMPRLNPEQTSLAHQYLDIAHLAAYHSRKT
jgi:dethiobiotin synthetase